MAFPRGGTEYRQENTTPGSRFTAQILRTSKQGIKPLYQPQACFKELISRTKVLPLSVRVSTYFLIWPTYDITSTALVTGYTIRIYEVSR